MSQTIAPPNGASKSNGYRTVLPSTDVGDTTVRLMHWAGQYLHLTVHYGERKWLRVVTNLETGETRTFWAPTVEATWETCMEAYHPDWKARRAP